MISTTFWKNDCSATYFQTAPKQFRSLYQVSKTYLASAVSFFWFLTCLIQQCTMDEIHSPRLTLTWPELERVISWCLWKTLTLYQLSHCFVTIVVKNVWNWGHKNDISAIFNGFQQIWLIFLKSSENLTFRRKCYRCPIVPP